MSELNVGISGMAAYFPRYRVGLQQWCEWNGDNWDKVRSVVGESYRIPGPDENAYTMAANALIRLIDQYDIDPERIGFLGLGTESSTDNSAGAVIVKGMVNDLLMARGAPVIARSCEVPEFKQACLGGVYALKAALRYLALDGEDKVGIVLCTDIAEYRRHSSGEPTQGAGAVALLVEHNPTLLSVDLKVSASTSDYRGPDFRKPFSRFVGQDIDPLGRVQDFPVINGKYSTTCYIDEVLAVTEDFNQRLGQTREQFWQDVGAVFLHRPYQRMAETGLAFMQLYRLATGSEEEQQTLAGYAAAADVDFDVLRQELEQREYVYQLVKNGDLGAELFPAAQQMIRTLRKQPQWQSLVADYLDLGAQDMQNVGNLYTASLPAWLAAGFEQALLENIDLSDRWIVTVGYGSGNAADIIPMRVVDGWQHAADKIRFGATLDDPQALDAAQYEALHARSGNVSGLQQHDHIFVIDNVGQGDQQFDDQGVETYRYLAS